MAVEIDGKALRGYDTLWVTVEHGKLTQALLKKFAWTGRKLLSPNGKLTFKAVVRNLPIDRILVLGPDVFAARSGAVTLLFQQHNRPFPDIEGQAFKSRLLFFGSRQGLVPMDDPDALSLLDQAEKENDAYVQDCERLRQLSIELSELIGSRVEVIRRFDGKLRIGGFQTEEDKVRIRQYINDNGYN